VVGQLDRGVAVLVAVADERQRVFPIRHVAPAQLLHAERLGVEIDAALQVADAQHGVQKTAHVWSPPSDVPALAKVVGSSPSRNSPAVSAASMAAARSASSVAPAANAIPRSPAAAASRTVSNPIVGRSVRRSWPGLT